MLPSCVKFHLPQSTREQLYLYLYIGSKGINRIHLIYQEVKRRRKSHVFDQNEVFLNVAILNVVGDANIT